MNASILYIPVRIAAGTVSLFIVVVINYRLTWDLRWQLNDLDAMLGELILPLISLLPGVMAGIALGPQFSTRWIGAGIQGVMGAFVIRSLALSFASLHYPIRGQWHVINLYAALAVFSVAAFSLLRCAVAAPAVPWAALRRNLIGYLAGSTAIIFAKAPYELFLTTIDPSKTMLILTPILIVVTVLASVVVFGLFSLSMQQFRSAVSGVGAAGVMRAKSQDSGKTEPGAFCTQCGKAVVDTAKFCVNCGARQRL